MMVHKMPASRLQIVVVASSVAQQLAREDLLQALAPVWYMIAHCYLVGKMRKARRGQFDRFAGPGAC